MATNLFEVSLGLSITDDNDVESLNILASNGAPGSLQIEDDAPRGSVAIDVLTGDIYSKTSQGSGTIRWTRSANVNDLVDTIKNISWKDAVLVRDNTSYANLSAAEAAMNTGSMDSVVVSDGDRILLTNLTTGTNDIYAISGTPGASATLVQVDTTASPDDGDTVTVQEGSSGDTQWSYNGTSWVQIGSSSGAELGYIRAFIGKVAAGSILPQYSSTNYVANNDDLVAAISALDSQIGTNTANITALTTSTTNLQTEVDNIETSLGPGVLPDGTFDPSALSGSLSTSTSITDALNALESGLASSNDDADIRAFIGKAAAGAETPNYSTNNIVTDGDDLEKAISDLDTFLAKERSEIVVSGNIGQNVVDSVLVDDVKAIEWWIWAQEDSGQGTRVVVVHGSHNGTPTTDASDSDRSEYSRLRLGNVNGFRTRVTLSGSGASQLLQLEVRTNNSSSLHIDRRVLV